MKARAPIRLYADFVRGVSILVLLYSVHYGLPAIKVNPPSLLASVVDTVKGSSLVSLLGIVGLMKSRGRPKAEARAAEGRTMILVIHEMAFARDAANRVVFTDHGRIVVDAPPAKVFGEQTHERLRSFLSRFAGFRPDPA